MDEQATDGAPEATAPTPTDDGATAPQGPTNAPQEQDGDQGPQDVASLPKWAQDLIKGVRHEAADYRSKAKTAADQARDAIVQDLGKALGLITDDNQAPSVDQLTTQVTAAQATAAEARRELAVYRAAAALHVDAAALTDSRSFLASISDVDPDDSKAFTDAIAAHVKTYPQHMPQAGASSTDQPGQAPGTVTPQEFKRMTVSQRTELRSTDPNLYARLAG